MTDFRRATHQCSRSRVLQVPLRRREVSGVARARGIVRPQSSAGSAIATSAGPKQIHSLLANAATVVEITIPPLAMETRVTWRARPPGVEQRNGNTLSVTHVVPHSAIGSARAVSTACVHGVCVPMGFVIFVKPIKSKGRIILPLCLQRTRQGRRSCIHRLAVASVVTLASASLDTVRGCVA